MALEIPLPEPDKLVEKPIKAWELHEYLNKNGVKPVVVRVDNAIGKVWLYFDAEPDEKTKKKVYDLVMDFYRRHIGSKV